ncbi:alpha-amylase family glycosyl hydrolase [uncultured Stenotrophomonas sp.]|uniref:alpha-amylase family glycosyl hydrolase n=1 Tax=uncultured Stenotrophomonas sp. TaxID=165438 RepID=UPI0025D079D5|nr:alpha-amylase family glycosyl hydrolase [uncultured Stenotrophomonas sp.]
MHPLRAIYQLAPYLFRDRYRLGWGTLDGITEKLDCLQWLGISHVWLLPFHCNAGRDGGYDVTDHYRIDPHSDDDAAIQSWSMLPTHAASASSSNGRRSTLPARTRGSSLHSRTARHDAAGTCGATTCLTTTCSRCFHRSRPRSGHGMPGPARSTGTCSTGKSRACHWTMRQ